MIKYALELGVLLKEFYTVSEIEKKRLEPDVQKIKLNNALGNVPFVYEKIRGSMNTEYRDERFIFKAAIFRILNRRILSEKNGELVAEGLLKELIWAKYLPNEMIVKDEIIAIGKVIEKYQFIIHKIDLHPIDRGDYVKWLVEILSSQVEDMIFPALHQKEEALLRFTYSALQSRVKNEDTRFQEVTDSEMRLQLKIQIHKIINKADFGDIHLKLLTEKYPGFHGSDEVTLEAIALDIVEIRKSFDHFLKNKFAEKLSGLIKRQSAIFIVIRDILEECEDVGEAQIVFSENEEILEASIKRVITQRIQSARKNLNRSLSRTVFVIFVTRLVTVLFFDLYLARQQDLLMLALNISFPVIILLGVGFTIRFPDKKDQWKLIENIKEVLDDQIDARSLILRRPYNTQLLVFFQIFSFLTFLFTYGSLVWLLVYFQFSMMNIITSLLFLSIVSFFAVRITENTRQLMVIERSVGLIGLLFDVFTFPIIKAGKVVSSEFDRWNVFVFIMDYIIEAPFKNILNVTEEWVNFMREQKDEIY